MSNYKKILNEAENLYRILASVPGYMSVQERAFLLSLNMAKFFPSEQNYESLQYFMTLIYNVWEQEFGNNRLKQTVAQKYMKCLY